MLTLGDVAPAGGEALDGKQLQAPLEKSLDELNQLLGEGWKEKSGLVMVTANDGTTEWVLEADKQRFAYKGAALLGDREALQAIEPPKEEVAARETAREQVGTLRKQQQLVGDKVAVVAAADGAPIDEATLDAKLDAKLKANNQMLLEAIRASQPPKSAACVLQ